MAVQKVGAIRALSFGWNVLRDDFWNLSLLAVVTLLLIVAGLIAFGVGVLVTEPVAIAAWGACYRDKTGVTEESAEAPGGEPPP